MVRTSSEVEYDVLNIEHGDYLKSSLRTDSMRSQWTGNGIVGREVQELEALTNQEIVHFDIRVGRWNARGIFDS